MTRICACRAALSEKQLTAAYSIGVRIEHDAEPCLLNESGEAGKLVGETSLGTESVKLVSRQRSQVQPRSQGVGGLRALQETASKSSGNSAAFPGEAEGGSPSRVVPAVIGIASPDSTRPVLTRLPRLTVVGASK